MTSTHADFWATIQAASDRVHHKLNLSGKTLAKCTADKCDNGITAQGYCDHDSYGPIYRDAEHCRVCGGRGQVEVACAPEVEAAAIKKEIAGLRARLRELGKGKK